MVAYLIIDLDVHDVDLFAQYQARFPSVAAKHGARYLVRGGETVVSGDWGEPIHRLVMFEFPDRSAIKAVFDDPDYQPLVLLRDSAATGRTIIVDGVDPADVPLP